MILAVSIAVFAFLVLPRLLAPRTLWTVVAPRPILQELPSRGGVVPIYSVGKESDPPVILAPGFAGGADYYLLEGEPGWGESPAEALAEQGFCVYTYTPAGYAGRGRRPHSAEDLLQDLEAVVKWVRQKHGVSPWVAGHGYGGVLSLALQPDDVAGRIAISTPLRRRSSTRFARWFTRNYAMFSVLPVVPLRALIRWFPWVLFLVRPGFLRMQLGTYVGTRHYLRFLWYAVYNISPHFLGEVLGWLAVRQIPLALHTDSSTWLLPVPGDAFSVEQDVERSAEMLKVSVLHWDWGDVRLAHMEQVAGFRAQDALWKRLGIWIHSQ